MSTPLLVFVPAAERDALRNGGVLPPAWFRDVGPAGWDAEAGTSCVRLWANEPDAGIDGKDGVPPHPARLLGLETAGISSFSNEDVVAKFFDSWILHVVFLDGEGGAGRSHRDPATGWTDVEPVLEAARWARSFNRSVAYWFSEEQSRNIRHAVLVIARGGRVRLTDEQRDALGTEFSEAGVLRTCYFLDFRLEVETGNDALHAECLWPILAGRLLLRLLVALSGNGDDDILLPGVHLWRSFEFLFDYPVVEMSGMLTKALDEAFRRLCEETDAATAETRAPVLAKGMFQVRNDEAGVFPGLPSALTAFGRDHLPEIRDWHVYPAAELARERTEDDERRWGGRVALAKKDFAGREAECFREGNPAAAAFSPDLVFPSVASDPRNVSFFLKRLKEVRPSDTIAADEIYRRWKAVVEADERRKEAQARLRKAGKELSLAQAHYVTAPYGILVSLSVSLFCGYTLFRALWSLGGNGAIPVSLFFAALSATGAFAAWVVVSVLHGRAGRKAAEQFTAEAEMVDAGMDARHEAAVQTIRAAETQHGKRLRGGSWESLHRLLERVWRILSRELQSPSLSAFYRGGDDGEPETPDANELEVRRQRDVFLGRTRFSESLREGMLGPGRREHSDRVLAEALRGNGPGSFHALWGSLCDSADGWHRGDLPAQILIPAIRRWIHELCDRLSAAQKADLLDARGGDAVLPAGFENIRGDAGYVLATAHVDDHETAEARARVFVFDESAGAAGARAGAGVARRARDVVQGAFADIPVTAAPVLNGLPQIALYFQDIRLFGFGRAADGRLTFLSRHEVAVAGDGERGPR